MERHEFSLQVDRIKEEWGENSYKRDRTEILWNHVKSIGPKAFGDAVTFFIGNSRRTPLVSDFCNVLRTHIDAVNKEKTENIPECPHCKKTGFVSSVSFNKEEGKFLSLGTLCYCSAPEAIGYSTELFPRLIDWGDYRYDPVFYKGLTKLILLGFAVPIELVKVFFTSYKKAGEKSFKAYVDQSIMGMFGLKPGDLVYNKDQENYTFKAIVVSKREKQMIKSLEYLGSSIEIRVPNSFIASMFINIDDIENLSAVIDSCYPPSGPSLSFDLYTDRSVKDVFAGQVLGLTLKVVPGPGLKKEPFPFEIISAKKYKGVKKKKDKFGHVKGFTKMGDNLIQQPLFDSPSGQR